MRHFPLRLNREGSPRSSWAIIMNLAAAVRDKEKKKELTSWRKQSRNRYEFVILFDVENGNPNERPRCPGNMPRIDS